MAGPIHHVFTTIDYNHDDATVYKCGFVSDMIFWLPKVENLMSYMVTTYRPCSKDSQLLRTLVRRIQVYIITEIVEKWLVS